jgi:hypothetical protein
MDRFRKDLEAAEIPYVDEQGRRADFHALRHTLATKKVSVLTIDTLLSKIAFLGLGKPRFCR